MKRLSRFYIFLFLAYFLFLLVLVLILTGCGANSAAPLAQEEQLALPSAPLGSWEALDAPCLAVHVNAAGGRLYYVPVAEDLAARIDEKLQNGPRLSGMAWERLDGWGDQLPGGVDELAVYYTSGRTSFTPFYRNAAGDYGLDGADITEEAKELLALVESVTGWDVTADPSDFTGLSKLELLLGDEVLLTITDTERLDRFAELLQNQTRAVSAAKTPGEVLELRCTCGDGVLRSVVADPDNPRLWLPPFCYYRYNAFESTGTLPLLEALGLEDWPEAIREAQQNGFRSVALAELFERLAPAPRPAAGMEELLYRLPTFDWTVYAEREGTAEALQAIYRLADCFEERYDADELPALACLQILAGASQIDGALAEAYDFVLARVYDKDPALYARCWRGLDAERQSRALPLLTWELSPEEAITKIKNS